MAHAPKPPQAELFTKSCTPQMEGRTCAGKTVEPSDNFGQVMVSKTKAIPEQAAALAATLGAESALGRIGGGGIHQNRYRWLMRGAALAGGSATIFIAGMLPTRMGDGTLYSDDQLREMNAAATRVRFQFRRDAEGALQLYGIHTTAESGDDSVGTVKAHWTSPRKKTLEADLGDGITIIFTPWNEALSNPKLIYPQHDDERIPPILVHPIAENTDSQIDGYPAIDDITLGDRIITFPIDTEMTSLYVVYSKPLAGDHSYHPAPKELAAFPDAVKQTSKSSVQGGGKKRARWKDQKGRIYEWDSQHGAVEMYDKQGKHLGEYNPATGVQTKPAKPGRKIEK